MAKMVGAQDDEEGSLLPSPPFLSSLLFFSTKPFSITHFNRHHNSNYNNNNKNNKLTLLSSTTPADNNRLSCSLVIVALVVCLFVSVIPDSPRPRNIPLSTYCPDLLRLL